MLRSDGIFILILFPDEMNAMSRWYLISICQRFNNFVSANKMFVKLNVFSNYKKISLSVNSIIHVCCGKKLYVFYQIYMRCHTLSFQEVYPLSPASTFCGQWQEQHSFLYVSGLHKK